MEKGVSTTTKRIYGNGVNLKTLEGEGYPCTSRTIVPGILEVFLPSQATCDGCKEEGWTGGTPITLFPVPALNSSLPKKYLPTPPKEIDSFLSSLQVKKIFLEGKLPSSDGKAVQEARSKLNLDERCPILPLFYRPLKAVDRSYGPYDKPSALLKVRILNTYGACIFLLPTLCAFHTFYFSPIFILYILPREIFFLSLMTLLLEI